MVPHKLVNIENDLVPDSAKPFPVPMFTYHHWGPLTFSSEGSFKGTGQEINHQIAFENAT